MFPFKPVQIISTQFLQDVEQIIGAAKENCVEWVRGEASNDPATLMTKSPPIPDDDGLPDTISVILCLHLLLPPHLLYFIPRIVVEQPTQLSWLTLHKFTFVGFVAIVIHTEPVTVGAHVDGVSS